MPRWQPNTGKEGRSSVNLKKSASSHKASQQSVKADPDAQLPTGPRKSRKKLGYVPLEETVQACPCLPGAGVERLGWSEQSDRAYLCQEATSPHPCTHLCTHTHTTLKRQTISILSTTITSQYKKKGKLEAFCPRGTGHL